MQEDLLARVPAAFLMQALICSVILFVAYSCLDDAKFHDDCYSVTDRSTDHSTKLILVAERAAAVVAISERGEI